MSGRFSQCTGLDAGANAYITKPFSPKCLLQCIQDLLQRLAATASQSQASYGRVGAASGLPSQSLQQE